MIKNSLFTKREWLLLLVIYVAAGAFYCCNLTHSGLWYDESIEYFYSKYIVGDIPLPNKYDNMYDRICSTYQPPLYNILMYFWLNLHDSEAFFRLSGVVFTFLGGIGLYFSLRRIVSYLWAIIGLCIYLSTFCIVIYTLECAEYNLLLSMECWMLYFFVQSAMPSNYERTTYIIGFYLFAALSFCSNYGASFMIAAMFISLFVYYLRDKDYKSIKWLIGIGIITVLLAILPIWIWFMMFQMESQQSLLIDHSPVFVNNLLYSIVVSFAYSLYSIFGNNIYILISVALTGIFTLYAATRSRRSPLLQMLILTSGVCWFLFFIASACSYYAYNSWDGRYGCYNIIDGTRYIIFITPLLIFTLLLGLHSFYHAVTSNNYYYRGLQIYIVILPFLFYFGMLKKGVPIKNDIRECTNAWIKMQGYKHPTLLQEWAAGTFHFYFRHSPVYNKQAEGNIITPDTLFRTKNESDLRNYLHELKTFSHKELYYIGNKGWVGAPAKMVKDIFIKEGYRVDTVGIEPFSIIFHLKREKI